MPQNLPQHPSLEFLKKRAKKLLRDFELGQSGAVERFRALAMPEKAGDRPQLSDAQLVIAREYGYTSWPKLKEHVDQLMEQELAPVIALVKRAIQEDDAAALQRLVELHPALKARINDRIGAFGSPLMNHARSRAMLDALIAAGADINTKSDWWAGSFGLLHTLKPELAAYAIERGATVDAHAAARLGMLERLKQLVSADPAVVHAPGGDGQTPLHFAPTIEIAGYLLDQGAQIDALDVDHQSTPAQYMLDSRHDVAGFLVQRGCKTDILMASALGDAALVRKHLEADPSCIHMRVSSEYFPMVGEGRAGGTIYQWNLGWYVSAHQVSRKFGHEDIFQWLMDRSPAEVRLLTACWLGDERAARSLLAHNRNLAASMTAAGRQQLAHAARNNDTTAVRLMLLAGLPVDSTSQHRATALHWASWHGNTKMVHAILEHHPPLEHADNDFQGTALSWAIHGSENGWHRDKGDYPATAEALLRAGAKPPTEANGSAAVRAVLQRYGVPG